MPANLQPKQQIIQHHIISPNVWLLCGPLILKIGNSSSFSSSVFKYLWWCCLNLKLTCPDHLLQVLTAAAQLLLQLCPLQPYLASESVVGSAVLKNVFKFKQAPLYDLYFQSLMCHFSAVCLEFGCTISLHRANVTEQDVNEPPTVSSSNEWPMH